jgi:hypothetical protein
MPRHLRSLGIAAFVAMLTACSGGPSDADVEAAMKARISEMDGGDAAATVLSAHNTGCRSSGGAYTCDVEVEMALQGMGNMKSVAQLRMIQKNGRWTYDDHQVLSMQGQAR